MLPQLKGDEIFQVLGTVGTTRVPSGSTETASVASIAAASTNFFALRVVTLPGDIDIEEDDFTVVVNKTIPEVTTVYAPFDPFFGQRFQLKDGNGSSVTYAITLDGNGELIDGATSILLNTGYEALELVFIGTGWSIVSSYSASSIPPGTNYLTDELGNKLTTEDGTRIVTG